MRSGRSFAYWAAATCSAVVLLLAASGAASSETFERVSGRGKPRSPYAVSNSANGKAVFRATNVKPGATGIGRVRLANRGRKPIRSVRLTQDKVVTSGISRALGLQIYDRTTKRCVYPAVKPPKPKRGKKPRKITSLPCRTWGPWQGGRALRNVALPARKGTAWKPREQHVLDVRWRLDASSANTDQSRTASFRLRWKFIG